jgi:GT2 family glycosyltransferase
MVELPKPDAAKKGWPWTEESQPLPETMPDGTPWPRITVVTPSYNQGWFIETTIRSVLLQGYANLEYIIMDGRSTDNTIEIIRRYEPWLTAWVSEPDKGQTDAIQKGFNQASGELLTWLNSDDLLLPNALRHVALASRQRPDAVAWVGGCQRIDRDGRLLNTITPRGLERERLANWFFDGFFYQPSCFFSANAYRQSGGVDPSLNFSMDVDLWLKLAAVGEFVPMPQTLSAAVIHDAAKSQSKKAEMHAEVMLVQIRHGFQEAAVRRMKRVLEGANRKQQKQHRFGRFMNLLMPINHKREIRNEK